MNDYIVSIKAYNKTCVFNIDKDKLLQSEYYKNIFNDTDLLERNLPIIDALCDNILISSRSIKRYFYEMFECGKCREKRNITYNKYTKKTIINNVDIQSGNLLLTDIDKYYILNDIFNHTNFETSIKRLKEIVIKVLHAINNIQFQDVGRMYILLTEVIPYMKYDVIVNTSTIDRIKIMVQVREHIFPNVLTTKIIHNNFSDVDILQYVPKREEYILNLNKNIIDKYYLKYISRFTFMPEYYSISNIVSLQDSDLVKHFKYILTYLKCNIFIKQINSLSTIEIYPDSTASIYNDIDNIRKYIYDNFIVTKECVSNNIITLYTYPYNFIICPGKNKNIYLEDNNFMINIDGLCKIIEKEQSIIQSSNKRLKYKPCTTYIQNKIYSSHNIDCCCVNDIGYKIWISTNIDALYDLTIVKKFTSRFRQYHIVIYINNIKHCEKLFNWKLHNKLIECMDIDKDIVLFSVKCNPSVPRDSVLNIYLTVVG
jgi:hypothetical protein